MSSIFTGVAGMQAAQQAVDVIANNVANVNTVAFKASRVTFEDTLVRTMAAGSSSGTNPMQVGMGVAVGSIDVQMEQGTLRPTGRALDLSVVGDGFFVVNDGATKHFTRDGVFQLDAQNRLVMASNGMAVVGWQADIFTGQLNTSTDPSSQIRIPIGTLYAVPTTRAVYGGNLNAAASVGDTVETSFTVYDSLGTGHVIDIEFEKTDAGEWDWTATSADAAALSSPGSGTLTFDAHGVLTSGLGSISLTLANPNGATSPAQFTVDFSAVSQLDGSDSVQATSQDGLPMGTLDSFSIESNGQITGSFSNGASRVIGQIALARFTNPAGLSKEGYNLWNVSPNSGEAVISSAGAGGGLIRSGYLELSNVDLATEFANLIVMQRGFQANSRSITTSDEMMQDVMQLKR